MEIPERECCGNCVEWRPFKDEKGKGNCKPNLYWASTFRSALANFTFASEHCYRYKAKEKESFNQP